MKFGKYELKAMQNPAICGLQWLIAFRNGYEASIISGEYANTDKENPYELAVLKDWCVCAMTRRLRMMSSVGWTNWASSRCWNVLRSCRTGCSPCRRGS